MFSFIHVPHHTPRAMATTDTQNFFPLPAPDAMADDRSGQGSGAFAATQGIQVRASGPTTQATGAGFSNDSGSADLITNVAAQIIFGTLNAALVAGETVEVSLNNGASWTTASASAGSINWSLAGQTLVSGTGREVQVRVSDSGGNHGSTVGFAYTLDTIAPNVTISSSAAGTLKAGDNATVTFSFSEAPDGFTVGDLSAVGLLVNDFTATANPTIYTATITPLASYQGPGTLQIGASSYTDVAGNAGAGSGVASVATVDSKAPTLAISSSKAALKAGETALITFTFSDAPVGFTDGGISATNGSLGPLTPTANPMVYTALFTPTPNLASGTASITVAAGAYHDAAGNAGGAGLSPPLSIDTLPPTAAPSGQPRFLNDTGLSTSDLVTSVSVQTVRGDLTAPLAAGEQVLVSFDNGNTWNHAADTGTTWSLAHNLTGSGTLKVCVFDAAGNPSSETSHDYALDQTAPTLTVSSNVSMANGVAPAVITFEFSEAPVGFDSTDITLAPANGTLGPLSPTSNPRIFTADFTPNSGIASGVTAITVAGTYQDLAGNAGAGASLPALLIDTVAPAAAAGGVQFLTDSGIAGDLITNVASQTLSGTLSAPLVPGNVVQLSLDNGLSWFTLSTSTGDTSWSVSRTLSGSSTLKVRVLDSAGNFSAPFSAPYSIDSTAPTATLASSATGPVGYGQSATITITLSDPATLTQAHLAVTGGTITSFSGSGTSYTATVTPPAGSTTPITANLAANAFTDVAGNGNTAAAALTLPVNTRPPDTGSLTPPVTTIDGVAVSTTPGPYGATITTVPVVPPGRTEAPGSGSPLADIPLVKGGDGHAILTVGVPVGVGLTAEGLATTTMGSAALAELGLRIERIAGTGNTELTNAGQVFYATLAPDERLNVQIIKPVLGPGYDGSQPLVIRGSGSPVDGKLAVIIDASALPSGTVIQVDGIDFVAAAGNVRLVGGAGQNMASGDGAVQWIVLGPGDDVIHGGSGNDVVGSEAGDDQVHGDAGDDTVFGGAGNDLLSGGAGSDRLNGGTGFDVAIQEGARTDYTVTLEGAGIKLTHTASGVPDWLVDVEQVRFASGPSLTVAHSAAEEAAAFLFQKWLGRELTQSEGAIVQTLAGHSAEQVASLFAQLFPTQLAGKTATQLLDGLSTAGAIRIDAVRDVFVSGDAAHNTITPTLGLARYVDGGAGIDTVVLPATLAQTHVQHNANGSFTLQRLTDGAMVDVTGVERVRFSDTTLALDLNGNAGQAAKLLGALAGPGILSNKGLVGEVIRLLDAGASSQSIAGLGLQLLGASTPTQVTQTLWTNVTGRAGTDGELKILTDIMAGGTSAADLVVMAANLDATAVRIDLVGLAAKGLEFA
jgi:hypothetical protein